MPCKVIEAFKKGDPVPIWLLDLEPATPGSQRPSAVFNIDCYAVETALGYVLIPDTETGKDFINISGNKDGATHEVIKLIPEKTVAIPLRFLMIGPTDAPTS